jgi:hypothetical protein
MTRNPTFLIDAPEVIYLPHGSLCYQVLKHEYVSSGPTSLIIQLTGWNKLVGCKASYRSMGTTGDPVPVGQRDVPVNHFTG